MRSVNGLWQAGAVFSHNEVFYDVIFSLSVFCRGAGGGEGEPDRDGANRQTETPASPQRALPLPAVRKSARHAHQVTNVSHLATVPTNSRSSSHGRTNHIAAHFLWLTCCSFSPVSPPLRGKCSVALLNETESVLSYLDKEVSQRGQTI